jgi:hypothetical protein
MLAITSVLFFTSVCYSNKNPYQICSFSTLNMTEDESIKVSFLNCFADSDGVIAKITLNLPSNITVTQIGDTFQLFPQLNFNGSVNGSVTARDDSGATVAASILINVQSIDDPPAFLAAIPDTSITNNSTLQLDLNSKVSDADDQKSSLVLTITPIQGLDVKINQLAISITPNKFIDTAHIELTVTDPAGLHNSTYFRLYTNASTPVGNSFSLQPGIPGTPFNNCVPIFRCTADSSFIRDLYTVYGQKQSKPIGIHLNDLSPSNDWESFNFGDSLTLIRYYSTKWHYFLLDRDFNITDLGLQK